MDENRPQTPSSALVLCLTVRRVLDLQAGEHKLQLLSLVDQHPLMKALIMPEQLSRDLLGTQALAPLSLLIPLNVHEIHHKLVQQLEHL